MVQTISRSENKIIIFPNYCLSITIDASYCNINGAIIKLMISKKLNQQFEKKKN